MVSGDQMGLSLCGLVRTGHARGEGGAISWICHSEKLDFHLQHSGMGKRSRKGCWCTCPCPWKRCSSNEWSTGRAEIWWVGHVEHSVAIWARARGADEGIVKRVG